MPGSFPSLLQALGSISTYLIQVWLLVCWYWKTMPPWKCDIEIFCQLWIAAVGPPRRTKFFIYCFVCVCSFKGLSLAKSVHSIHSKTQSMVKGKWNIFLQFLMVDALSQCHPLKRRFQENKCIIGSVKLKNKVLFNSAWHHVSPRGQCCSVYKLKHKRFSIISIQIINNHWHHWNINKYYLKRTNLSHFCVYYIWLINF